MAHRLTALGFGDQPTPLVTAEHQTSFSQSVREEHGSLRKLFDYLTLAVIHPCSKSDQDKTVVGIWSFPYQSHQ